jgi:hypothetical protein
MPQATPRQGVPSFSRKGIVENIALCDASKIPLSNRVALDSGQPAEPGRGSLCPVKNQIKKSFSLFF